MNWISIGIRKQSILDKSLKLTSWSKNLRRELGCGYTEFITTKTGDQFVKSEEDNKVLKLAGKLNNFNKYVQLMDEMDERILGILKDKKIDYLKVFDLQLNQLTYFLIAKMIADNIYKKSPANIKKEIEMWRNRKSLFVSESKVFKSLVFYLNIPVKTLNGMILEELKDSLQGKEVNFKDINKRLSRQWSLVLKNNQIKVFLEILSPIKTQTRTQTQTQTQTKVIKGKSAYVVDKKIKGIVGKDILVTSMTHPGMLPKIRKMKAVITDEGGVLCHAAITAREFKIPTIIGTKIATKVLKKGDKVGIDANNGVVKILG